MNKSLLNPTRSLESYTDREGFDSNILSTHKQPYRSSNLKKSESDSNIRSVAKNSQSSHLSVQSINELEDNHQTQIQNQFGLSNSKIYRVAPPYNSNPEPTDHNRSRFILDSDNRLNENNQFFYVNTLNSLKQPLPPQAPKNSRVQRPNQNTKPNNSSPQSVSYLKHNSNHNTTQNLQYINPSTKVNFYSNNEQLSSNHILQPQQFINSNTSSNNVTAIMDLVTALPPIIAGKRINLPLGPHRYL